MRAPKGSTPYSIQWTRRDSQRAQKMGWDLSDAGDRFEIKVVTENPAGFVEGGDDDAVAWMIKKAIEGDRTCTKGLLFAGLLDPQWFAADLSHAVKTGRVTILNMMKKPTKPRSVVRHRSSGDLEPTDHFEKRKE